LALIRCRQRPQFTLSEVEAPLHFRGQYLHAILVVYRHEMHTTKQDVEQLLNKLPDDCSVEDIQYHLYVLDKVRRGLEDARVNGTLSQEEVETRLSKWLTE
jgi:hypothetical protein